MRWLIKGRPRSPGADEPEEVYASKDLYVDGTYMERSSY
jgi:hypothetical protein